MKSAAQTPEPVTWKQKMEDDQAWLVSLGWCPKCGSAPGRPCDCEARDA